MSRLTLNDAEHRYFATKFPDTEVNYFINAVQTLFGPSNINNTNLESGAVSQNMGFPNSITVFISGVALAGGFSFTIYLSPDGINYYEASTDVTISASGGSQVLQVQGAPFLMIKGASAYTTEQALIQIVANY